MLIRTMKDWELAKKKGSLSRPNHQRKKHARKQRRKELLTLLCHLQEEKVPLAHHGLCGLFIQKKQQPIDGIADFLSQ